VYIDDMNNKQQRETMIKITLTDGFVFYEQINGTFKDNQKGIDFDLSYNNFNQIINDNFVSIQKIEQQ
tara:strand:- start:613 stop:816 length:204 start_codon:yes stop_codon:yes gene_type:complete